eukprot:Hpha_TRINITY_DN24115_c0_g1::TRINITY_DN24115_c0_g1_i1::g.9858::m.9858
MDKHSGDTCSIECPQGWVGTGGGFELVCVDHKFDVPHSIKCAPLCAGGPRFSGDADLSGCLSQASGDTCYPQCGPYHSSAGGFTLECDDKGVFTPPSTLCTPNSCLGGPQHSPEGGAGWGECNEKVTGDKCVPVCGDGYSTQGFILECDSKGTYTAKHTACEANICSDTPHKAFNHCLGMHTAQYCTPACAGGYHPKGDVELVCDADGKVTNSDPTCLQNECIPPHSRYPEYVFVDGGCTTVTQCFNAGVGCRRGAVEALTGE